MHRVKASRTALLLTAALAFAACGDDEDGQKDAAKPAAQEASLTPKLKRYIEKDIVRGAKQEDRQAGNAPGDYEYRIQCSAKSDTRLDCTLELFGNGEDPVNEVVYRVDVTPATGEFDYRVVSNRDTRKGKN